MTQNNALNTALGALAVLLLSVRVFTQATPIQCPSTLRVQESTDLANLEGWRPYDTSHEGIHHFYDIAFSEGAPERLVYQTPSNSTSTKRKKVDVYDFTRFTDDIWISCLYRDTSQSLTRKLERKFSRCEVAYDEKTGFRSVKQVECF